MKKIDLTLIKSLLIMSSLAIYTLLSIVILLGCILSILNIIGVISAHSKMYSFEECVCFAFMTSGNLYFVYKYLSSYNM